ncbi:MAG: prolipoprotein diacylglyceryl transferase [Phycisphaeraceae bacterium]
MMLVMAAWIHDIDPVAIGPVRWYGLSYVLGFILAWLLMRRVTRVGISPIEPAQVTDLVLWLGVGVLLGGRLGYALLYQPELFIEFSGELPFWGLLAIHRGGMASHGGMIGCAVAALLFARRTGVNRFFLLDLMAFAAPLGLAGGRVANFINGELIGREAPDGLPWAVKFPQEMRDWDDAHLAELYAALPPAWQVNERLDHWSLSAVQAMVQRGQPDVIAVVEPMLIARHPSQLYAALLEGLVVFAVLAFVWRRPRVPGLVVSLFAIVYGIGRIVGEMFRRPDPHLLDAEFALLDITRGQWLSALLVAVGVWGLWYVHRRGASPLGGWRAVASNKAR